VYNKVFVWGEGAKLQLKPIGRFQDSIADCSTMKVR